MTKLSMLQKMYYYAKNAVWLQISNDKVFFFTKTMVFYIVVYRNKMEFHHTERGQIVNIKTGEHRSALALISICAN